LVDTTEVTFDEKVDHGVLACSVHDHYSELELLIDAPAHRTAPFPR